LIASLEDLIPDYFCKKPGLFSGNNRLCLITFENRVIIFRYSIPVSDLMHPKNITTAADIIWLAWQQEHSIENLPSVCRPQSLEQGYAIQAALSARAGQPVAGWKIAATSVAGQAHIAVGGPLAGRLFADRISHDKSTIALGAANVMCVAEAEFAFRLAGDLAPRLEPYTQEEVSACVAELYPAIEIPNSRFADFVDAGGAQLVADNACAHRFVLGEKAATGWRDFNLATHPVRLYINDQLVTQGQGSDALGDPRIALTWIANNHALQGEGLRAGQIITTGVCGKPGAIKAGDQVVADFGDFGRVAVTIEC
jgi:2-keto-4-pentenoate hydratase